MSLPTPAYNVLLYYCYTPIEDPYAFREAHYRYCAQRNLLGRVIIAKEGINGTLSGLQADCEAYMAMLKADPRFDKLAFKVDVHPHHTFQKLHVRVKKEIVHAGLPHLDPTKKTGTPIDPWTFRKMKEEPDVVVVDARSNYEHRLGRFKDSVTLDINHFREFPKKVNELLPYKEKKIIAVCTGNIKCEKFTAYLLEQGFPQVYQLAGGIIAYGLATDGADFEGSCYVFDNRLKVTINRKNPVVIATCFSCQMLCERLVNCANAACNRHICLCEACSEQLQGACSTACQHHPAKRAYNGTGYYTTALNGYNTAKTLQAYKRQAYLLREAGPQLFSQ